MWKLFRTKHPKQKNWSKILEALDTLILDILVHMVTVTSQITLFLFIYLCMCAWLSYAHIYSIQTAYVTLHPG